MSLDPTDDEVRSVVAIWQAACGAPIERSLLVLMSSVALLIADSDRPAFWWQAVLQGVERRLADYQAQPNATHTGPRSVQ